MPDAPASPWIIGETVPWAVAWSGEARFGLQRSTDFPGFMEVIQEENPGVGRPMFAANHANRNKRGMFEQRCHICGTLTKNWDRWLFPLQTGGMVPLGDGQFRYGCNVPPVHKACAERAQNQCPHLSKLNAEMVRFPKEDEGRMVYRTDIQPGMEALAEQLPKGVDIVMSCYRLHGPRFSKQVARMLQDAGLADR